MYHAIVERKIRRAFADINAGRYGASPRSLRTSTGTRWWASTH